MKRFPYSLVYTVSGEEIRILAVITAVVLAIGLAEPETVRRAFVPNLAESERLPITISRIFQLHSKVMSNNGCLPEHLVG